MSALCYSRARFGASFAEQCDAIAYEKQSDV